MNSEKQVEKINNYDIKNWCVSCGSFQKIDWTRFQTRGNYCGTCNNQAAVKAQRKGIFRTNIRQLLGE